jgi:hypothetical protein
MGLNDLILSSMIKERQVLIIIVVTSQCQEVDLSPPQNLGGLRTNEEGNIARRKRDAKKRP